MSPNEIHLGSCFVLLEDELGKQIFQKVKISKPKLWCLKICDLSNRLVDPELSHLKPQLVGDISQPDLRRIGRISAQGKVEKDLSKQKEEEYFSISLD